MEIWEKGPIHLSALPQNHLFIFVSVYQNVYPFTINAMLQVRCRDRYELIGQGKISDFGGRSALISIWLHFLRAM